MAEIDQEELIASAQADALVHDYTSSLRENSVSRAIDGIVGFVGELFSWLWVALLVVIIGNVILRYVFSQGMIELEDLQWYLYAAAWLVGMSYTFIHDGHVRVDVIYESRSRTTQLWLEMFGLLVLFLPFVCFVFYFSLPFVELSWVKGETSTSANGLPMRWLIKGCLAFSFVLLFLVGVSRVIRVASTIKHGSVTSTKAP